MRALVHLGAGLIAATAVPTLRTVAGKDSPRAGACRFASASQIQTLVSLRADGVQPAAVPTLGAVAGEAVEPAFTRGWAAAIHCGRVAPTTALVYLRTGSIVAMPGPTLRARTDELVHAVDAPGRPAAVDAFAMVDGGAGPVDAVG